MCIYVSAKIYKCSVIIRHMIDHDTVYIIVPDNMSDFDSNTFHDTRSLELNYSHFSHFRAIRFIINMTMDKNHD